MATAAPSLPDEQQPQQVMPSNSQDSGSWHSSGSIGPFLAVISVLTVLAILSCFLGRICRNRRSLSTPPPLDCVKERGWRGWMRRWRFMDGGDEVVPSGDKAIVAAGQHEGKAHQEVV